MLDSEVRSVLWAITLDSLFFLICTLLKHARKMSVERRLSRSRLRLDSSSFGGVVKRAAGGFDAERSSWRSMDLLAKDATGGAIAGHQYYRWPIAPIMAVLGEPRSLNHGSQFFWLIERFGQICIAMLLVMTAVACTILLPIYATGVSTRPLTWFGQASITSIHGTDDIVYSLVIALLFMGVAASTFLSFLKESDRFRVADRNGDVDLDQGSSEGTGLLSGDLRSTSSPDALPAMPRTLHIQRIPTMEITEQSVRQFMHDAFPSEIDRVHLVPDLTEAKILHARIQSIVARIDRARYKGADYSQLDAEYRATGRQLTSSIHAAIDVHHGRNAGHAFVSFNSTQQAHRALKNWDVALRTEGAARVQAAQWKVRAAPPCEDIEWFNLGLGNTNRTLRTWLGNMFLCITMVLLITPATVLRPLSMLWTNIMPEEGKITRQEQQIITDTAIPALAVFLVNTLLLPWLIWVVAVFQREVLISETERTQMSKNAIFLFFNALFLPTLAMRSIDQFIDSDYAEHLDQWQSIFGTHFVNSSGHFFICYLIHASILSPAADQLDIGGIIQRWWFKLFAVTPAEIQIAIGPIDFSSGYMLSYNLTMFGIALVYSVTVPILLPFALFFFISTGASASHVLSTGMRRIDPTATLQGMVYTLILYGFAYVIMFMLAVTSILAVQGKAEFQICAAILLAFAICSLMVWLYYLHNGRDDLELHAVKSAGHEQSFQVGYTHPLLRWELTEPSSDL